MRFSAADWCFYSGHHSPESYYADLRAIGVSAVEMVPAERWPAVREAGLPILNIGAPGMQEGMNDPANHPALIPQIADCICDAQSAGIPHVIVFSGNRQGKSDEKGIENCAVALRKLAPIAERAGVTLIFEMLNSYDHADYQADSTAFGVELLRRVNSPALKMLYDAYHMSRMGEDIFADLRAYRDIIAHVHLAQTPARTAPLPGGPIDHTAVIATLKEIGYQGYIGPEYLAQGPALEELAGVVSYLRS